MRLVAINGIKGLSNARNGRRAVAAVATPLVADEIRAHEPGLRRARELVAGRVSHDREP